MKEAINKKLSASLAITILVLLVTSIIIPSIVIAQSSPQHTVTYIGVQQNFPNPGQSTWYYKVTSSGSPAISHTIFMFACWDSVVDAGTWTNLNTLNPVANWSAGKDGSTGIWGLKFNEGFNEDYRNYYFTVNQVYSPTTIGYTIKAGQLLLSGSITGPDCVVITTTTTVPTTTATTTTATTTTATTTTETTTTVPTTTVTTTTTTNTTTTVPTTTGTTTTGTTTTGTTTTGTTTTGTTTTGTTTTGTTTTGTSTTETTTTGTSTTGTTTTPTTAITTTPPDDEPPVIPFFLLLGGAGLIIGIIIALLALLLLKAAASDFDSLKILRKDGSLKDMRRILVTPETWAELGADKSKLKMALEDANVKITVQQVDKKSPLVNSLIKKLKMDLPAAQVIMIASIKKLKYIWLDGKRLNAKKLLDQVD